VQRRTAVTAASAISVTLVSAVVALGANLGALGFAKATPTPSAAPAAVTVQSSESQKAPAPSTATSRDRESGERSDHEDNEQEGPSSATNGEQALAPTGARDD